MDGKMFTLSTVRRVAICSLFVDNNDFSLTTWERTRWGKEVVSNFANLVLGLDQVAGLHNVALCASSWGLHHRAAHLLLSWEEECEIFIDQEDLCSHQVWGLTRSLTSDTSAGPENHCWTILYISPRFFSSWSHCDDLFKKHTLTVSNVVATAVESPNWVVSFRIIVCLVIINLTRFFGCNLFLLLWGVGWFSSLPEGSPSWSGCKRHLLKSPQISDYQTLKNLVIKC